MMGIVRESRALSQVSTSFSIYMALQLPTALEGCHRPEELFHAACVVS